MVAVLLVVVAVVLLLLAPFFHSDSCIGSVTLFLRGGVAKDPEIWVVVNVHTRYVIHHGWLALASPFTIHPSPMCHLLFFKFLTRLKKNEVTKGKRIFPDETRTRNLQIRSLSRYLCATRKITAEPRDKHGLLGQKSLSKV